MNENCIKEDSYCNVPARMCISAYLEVEQFYSYQADYSWLKLNNYNLVKWLSIADYLIFVVGGSFSVQ